MSTDAGTEIGIPPSPTGYQIDIPGRGSMFFRELAGPPGAPAVVLLHGWTATADLNWFACYQSLGQHYRVIAPDHRGHGRGIRSRRAFRLEDCADDVAALCSIVGIDRFVPVGYSMGGAVAQLLWRRHPERLAGLVLSATAAKFASTREEKLSFMGLSGLGAIARATPAPARAWLTEQFYLQPRRDDWGPWAIGEASRHDWRMILQAGGAIGSFSSLPWLHEVDVPTSVIVTLRDSVVPVRRQLQMVQALPNPHVLRVDGDHGAAVAQADRYVPVLLDALRTVSGR